MFGRNRGYFKKTNSIFSTTGHHKLYSADEQTWMAIMDCFREFVKIRCGFTDDFVRERRAFQEEYTVLWGGGGVKRRKFR